MKDLVRKLILDQWVMIQLLSTATKELARLSPSLTVSSSFWKRVSLCGLVNGKKKKKKKKPGKLEQQIDAKKFSTSDSFKIHTRVWTSVEN